MNEVSEVAYATPGLLAYVVVCTALLLGSYWFLDILTPGKLTTIIKNGGWNASALAAAQMLSVALIIVFAMLGQPVSLEGIILASAFAIVGTLFQGLATWVIRKVWLQDTDLESLLADKLTPPGFFLAASCLAVGLVIATAVY